MAKTRIKNTPTRLQKDAMMASSAVNGNASIITVVGEDMKKRIITPMRSSNGAIKTSPSKTDLNASSTIIVPAPKRTSSISSSTSTLSRVSDTLSTHSSDAESPPPAALSAAATSHTTTAVSLASALKNRKIYMITERCDDNYAAENGAQLPGAGAMGGTHNGAGQKRKMFLIMEENSEAMGAPNDVHNEGRKTARNADGIAIPPKKLTLVTDKCDGEMTQKFERILPEILNRIQGKAMAIKKEQDEELLLEESAKARTPITLPPKKNRNKLSLQNQTSDNARERELQLPMQQPISAATPVIVSAAALSNNAAKTITTTSSAMSSSNGQNSAPSQVLSYAASQPSAKRSLPNNNHSNNNKNNSSIMSNSNGSCHAANDDEREEEEEVPQKNINLSTDFLFLMKILPRLESIPEPHKNHVKNCIEKIVSQNATIIDDK